MKTTELKPELLNESVDFLEAFFKNSGIKLHPGSWLATYFSVTRNIANGKFYRNKRNAFVINSMVVFLREALEACAKEIDIREKIKKFSSVKSANHLFHEFLVLEGLLQAGVQASFIEETTDQTPDIEIVNKGAIECKTVRSPQKVVLRLKEALGQLEKTPGIKLADIFLYFPIRDEEIENFGMQIAQVVDEKMFRIDNISGLHGFTLRYMELRNLPDGKPAITLKGWSRFVKEPSTGAEDIFLSLARL